MQVWAKFAGEAVRGSSQSRHHVDGIRLLEQRPPAATCVWLPTDMAQTPRNRFQLSLRCLANPAWALTEFCESHLCASRTMTRDDRTAADGTLVFSYSITSEYNHLPSCWEMGTVAQKCRWGHVWALLEDHAGWRRPGAARVDACCCSTESGTTQTCRWRRLFAGSHFDTVCCSQHCFLFFSFMAVVSAKSSSFFFLLSFTSSTRTSQDNTSVVVGPRVCIVLLRNSV